MSVITKCDSCGQLDNCMIYMNPRKWLCDYCWSEYERIDALNDDHECEHCGSPYCYFDECKEAPESRGG